jgi:hypothetical protein
MWFFEAEESKFDRGHESPRGEIENNQVGPACRAGLRGVLPSVCTPAKIPERYPET